MATTRAARDLGPRLEPAGEPPPQAHEGCGRAVRAAAGAWVPGGVVMDPSAPASAPAGRSAAGRHLAGLVAEILCLVRAGADGYLPRTDRGGLVRHRHDGLCAVEAQYRGHAGDGVPTVDNATAARVAVDCLIDLGLENAAAALAALCDQADRAELPRPEGGDGPLRVPVRHYTAADACRLNVLLEEAHRELARAGAVAGVTGTLDGHDSADVGVGDAGTGLHLLATHSSVTVRDAGPGDDGRTGDARTRTSLADASPAALALLALKVACDRIDAAHPRRGQPTGPLDGVFDIPGLLRGTEVVAPGGYEYAAPRSELAAVRWPAWQRANWGRPRIRADGRQDAAAGDPALAYTLVGAQGGLPTVATVRVRLRDGVEFVDLRTTPGSHLPLAGLAFGADQQVAIMAFFAAESARRGAALEFAADWPPAGAAGQQLDNHPLRQLHQAGLATVCPDAGCVNVRCHAPAACATRLLLRCQHTPGQLLAHTRDPESAAARRLDAWGVAPLAAVGPAVRVHYRAAPGTDWAEDQGGYAALRQRPGRAWADLDVASIAHCRRLLADRAARGGVAVADAVAGVLQGVLHHALTEARLAGLAGLDVRSGSHIIQAELRRLLAAARGHGCVADFRGGCRVYGPDKTLRSFGDPGMEAT